MVLKKVSSSLLDYIGYEPTVQVLRVVFKTGAHYEYEEVPQDVYQQCMESKSVGAFFHKNIKNSYTFKKMS